MARGLVAALIFVSAAAYAQVDGGSPPQTNDTTTSSGATSPDDVRREVDQKVEAAKREMRDQISELRGQMATQSVAEGWQEEWVEEKRKLELFTLDGYLRVRPDLFNKLDLGRDPDPTGATLFPKSPTSTKERTQAGANMRFRVEPTLNVSEEVRIRSQIDILDNLVLGSTPDYAFGGSESNPYGIFSESQATPRSGINSLNDSVHVKRVYGEVSTPVGILRFGRMGSQWGLGMLHNDGNCIDCDFGDTVDRVQFVSEPFPGYYVTPMMDFNVEGPISQKHGDYAGQPYDLSNSDDAHSYIVAVARRDTDSQAKARLENNLAVFNYGAYFTYRTQKNDAVDFYTGQFQGAGGDQNQAGSLNGTFVNRQATIYVPDIWVKFEKKNFRIELEAASIIGQINNHALSAAAASDNGQNHALSVLEFGGVLQGEYKLLDGALHIRGEVGYASGDKAPGMGNKPGAKGSGPDGDTQKTDIDGPQYSCQPTGVCQDDAINNFRFNRDYRVDMILWREIYGQVTDAVYVKPGVSYQIGDGIHLFGDVIYSRAMYAASTPSGTDPNLGVEIDLGARYETEDGFYAQLRWGILFPLAGLDQSNRPANDTRSLDTAQAVRGNIGIRF
ncbi:MAG: TIGR04551 family protein [Myxococcaceae bacterium]